MQTSRAYDPKLFRLDEESHEYYYGLLPVPGLSKILQAEGLSDYSAVPPHILAKARDRGRIVHKAIYDHLHGAAPDAGPYDGYLDAAKRYLDDYVTSIKMVEAPVLDVKGWVACTPDLLSGTDHLIEWKTSSRLMDFHAYQIAGQADMLESAGVIESALHIRKSAVRLKADGFYEESPDDFCDRLEADMVWFAARTLYYAKHKDMARIAKQGRRELEID